MLRVVDCVRPALLMGERDWFAVHIVGLVTSSVGRVFGNRYVEGHRRCIFFVIQNKTEILRAMQYTYWAAA